MCVYKYVCVSAYVKQLEEDRSQENIFEIQK